MLKILMVLPGEFPPDVRVENEINTLIENGLSIDLACITKKNLPVLDNYKNAKIFRKEISTFQYKSSVACLKFPFYFNFWKEFLNRLFIQEQYKAIHIHDLPLASLGYHFGKKYNIPFILDLHENWPAMLEEATHTNTFLGKILSSNKQWRTYEKNYSHKANYIITVIEEMKERIQKLGVDGQKIIVLPNTGNKPTEINNSKQRTEKNILFYAGGITEHRGLQYVIPGIKKITDKGYQIELWISGKGSYEKQLKNIVQKFQVESYVKFFGYKPPMEMNQLLKQATIGLIPHKKSVQTDNSSPNKIYQYMAAGKPILTSNCNSLMRLVNETQSGIYYEYNNSEDFANKCMELISNDKKLKFMGLNGIKATNENLNWENTSKPLVELYKRIEQDA